MLNIDKERLTIGKIHPSNPLDLINRQVHWSNRGENLISEDLA